MNLPELPDFKGMLDNVRDKVSTGRGNTVAVKNPVDRSLIARRSIFLAEMVVIAVLVLWIFTMFI